MTPRPFAIVLVSALATGCASSQSALEAGGEYGGVPDLRGLSVMLLPAQGVRGVADDGSVDLEIAFALEGRSQQVEWVLPEEMRTVLARSPGVQVGIDALPVGAFLRAEVERVGDPLYGQLRRLSALTGAELALIPVEVRYRDATAERPGAVEIAATLLTTRTGRVYWFGVVEGAAGSPDDPAALASAADALARRMVR